MAVTPKYTQTALQTNTLYSTRGTIGTAAFYTNDRFYSQVVLHENIKNLTLAHPEWATLQKIPKKNNEIVRWRKRNRATGGVYRLADGGVQAGGTTGYNPATDTVDIAQTSGNPLVSIVLNGDSVELSPRRYGTIFRYTPSDGSISLDDPIAEATEEMGLMCASQQDYLWRSLFESYAAEVFPSSLLTSEADTDWNATTHVLNLDYLLKTSAYLRANSMRPPAGLAKFPLVIHPYGSITLLQDTATQAMLRESGNRADPMVRQYMDTYIGELAAFSIFESPRIVGVTLNTAGAVFTGYPGYVFVDGAIGSCAMEDPDYGSMPDATQDGEFVVRSNTDYPQPVQVITHEPGTSGAFDPLNEMGTIAEKHTIALTNLYSERLIRLCYSVSTAVNFGTQAGSAVGSVV